MKHGTRMRRAAGAALLSFLLAATVPAGAAIPSSWKDTGFSIDATGLTLGQVFEEFGRVFGVRLSVSLGRDALMKGRLKADNGIDFLDRLAQPYKFRWFVYSDTLYIVPRDDNASMRLEVGEDAVQDAKDALIGIGLFDPRFGWGELPDEGIVIVSGPREYVNLARAILLPEDRKNALRGRQVMVFRLKYASAMDRVINSRGRSEVIPGIKTILTRLIASGDTGDRTSDARASLDTDSRKRSRAPKVGRGGAREIGPGLFGAPGQAGAMERNEAADAEDPERASRARMQGGDGRPRIEADPSLNAVMIYDTPSRRDLYASLIEQLDVEPRQVEIEALIVDIDRNKLAELGVEWGVRSPGGRVTSRINSTAGESRGIELPLPGSTLLISNAARFYARLKAMEGNGEARVLATPTVLTLDNVAAVLDLSQTRYMPLLAERYADLADVTAGTMLRVIPRLIGEVDATRVRLEVDIEDGSLGDSTASANVTRSTISTQAIVDLQQTLVIGGYHAESMGREQNKVPLLGDVPLVGNLFRSTSETYGSRERLFLITPRLVGSGGTGASRHSNIADRHPGAIAQARTRIGELRPSQVPAAVASAGPARSSAAGAVMEDSARNHAVRDGSPPQPPATARIDDRERADNGRATPSGADSPPYLANHQEAFSSGSVFNRKAPTSAIPGPSAAASPVPPVPVAPAASAASRVHPAPAFAPPSAALPPSVPNDKAGRTAAIPASAAAAVSPAPGRPAHSVPHVRNAGTPASPPIIGAVDLAMADGRYRSSPLPPRPGR
ncbi:MAG TPA: type III secretion system outer membrane ring subunit SctC [Noviherbaspirillum sp.]|jgi:type III secretion protein C|uniref:type III secretion system outer membrane ring subunit SctC n=1 Tax=Noviherbaspirillum sp. TaxID=1926288 RepID=UPI002F95F56D